MEITNQRREVDSLTARITALSYQLKTAIDHAPLRTSKRRAQYVELLLAEVEPGQVDSLEHTMAVLTALILNAHTEKPFREIHKIARLMRFSGMRHLIEKLTPDAIAARQLLLDSSYLDHSVAVEIWQEIMLARADNALPVAMFMVERKIRETDQAIAMVDMHHPALSSGIL